jgi:hypothetical protein
MLQVRGDCTFAKRSVSRRNCREQPDVHRLVHRVTKARYVLARLDIAECIVDGIAVRW